MLHRLTQLSRAFGLILGTFATYMLFVACGEALGEAISCFDNSDCASEEVCVGGFCQRTCVNDEDCFEFQRCGSRIVDGSTINVCQESAPNNVDTGCNTSEECIERLGNPEAQCAVDGICFVPEPSYAILIRDRSVVDPLAPRDQGLGADFSAVYLASEEGEVIAQGDTLVIQTANEVMLPNGVIDGNPPSLNDTQTCIAAGFDGNVASLGGEGGFMLVRFLDTDFREYEQPPETWNIVVLEWDDNCDGGVNDEYEVFFCETTSFNDIDLENDCDSLGLASGSRVFQGPAQ